ncbi:MAG: hypothetical protein GY913_03360 [Proteobacteria bacterium]|nr:hypothetical protein [Pseudomonadota bacterium]MCP4915938.1 hypothetical protein [Pseudomonadota bacterium]
MWFLLLSSVSSAELDFPLLAPMIGTEVQIGPMKGRVLDSPSWFSSCGQACANLIPTEASSDAIADLLTLFARTVGWMVHPGVEVDVTLGAMGPEGCREISVDLGRHDRASFPESEKDYRRRYGNAQGVLFALRSVAAHCPMGPFEPGGTGHLSTSPSVGSTLLPTTSSWEAEIHYRQYPWQERFPACHPGNDP